MLVVFRHSILIVSIPFINHTYCNEQLSMPTIGILYLLLSHSVICYNEQFM